MFLKSFISILLLLPLLLYAQKVSYSPLVSDAATSRFEVVGKTGDYYWIQKNKRKITSRKSKQPEEREITFEAYDGRYNFVRSVAFVVPDNSVKEYFVPGDEFLDRLMFSRSNKNIIVSLDRISPASDSLINKDSIVSFPAVMDAANFVMIRSDDRKKILLLGFDPVSDSSNGISAYCFDENWKELGFIRLDDRNISQPFVQYDRVEYLSENFTGSPVKIANNGEWFMISRSAKLGKLLLLHFNGMDPNYSYKEIPCKLNNPVDEVAMSYSNDSKKLTAGILLSTLNRAVKYAIVSEYLASECRIVFDSSYRFRATATGKRIDENIYQEYFLPVPGKGFMFLKEYGRQVQYVNLKGQPYQNEEPELNGEPAAINRNEYTRYNNLAGSRSNFERGDLSLYFFPSSSNDTCWSGILNKQQTDELNSANLSYVFMPVQDKLVFMYNAIMRDYKLSASTILDAKGNPVNEGIIFWRAANTLNFSRARQITKHELAIPYARNAMNGFAIIKL